MQGEGEQEYADYQAECEAMAQAEGEYPASMNLEAEHHHASIDSEAKEEIQMEETKEETFKRELKELKTSRENDIEYRKVWQGLLDEFEAKHNGMLTSMKENQEAMSKLEESIKTKALVEYAADESKNKKLAFGVGIRAMKDVLFDDDLAKEWAKKTGLCLKLDVPAFKKIAKTTEIDFVTIKERAIATIPTEIKLN